MDTGRVLEGTMDLRLDLDLDLVMDLDMDMGSRYSVQDLLNLRFE